MSDELVVMTISSESLGYTALQIWDQASGKPVFAPECPRYDNR